MIDAGTEKPILSALACPNLSLNEEEETGLLMISVASIGNFV